MAKEQNKKYEIDMCNGPILKKMLMFALPLMASSILQLLFNAADIIVVGRFAGDNSMAAVGSNTALINLLTNLFVGLSIGANVVVSRDYGAGKEDRVSKTVHTAMALGILSGIFLTIVGVIGAKQILIWMQTPEEVLPLATTYLRIYFLGMTATMVYNFGSAILRAIGDTKRSMYYLMAAGIVNVALNLVFVVVLKLDVAGVALATAISQCISAVLIVICLVKESGGIKLDFKKLKINKKKFVQILKIGLPAGFQGILFSLSNVVIQSSVNSFGSIIVAGNSAAANIEGFVYVSMNAFYQATISFTAQNMGAGNYKRINKILLRGQICVTVVGVGLGNLALLFGQPLLSIYSSNQKVINAGIVRMGIVSRTYALCGMMDVMVGALRGIGYSILPMIVSLLGACVFRLIWIATIFQIERFHTIDMLYISYPISWILTVIAHVICYIMAMKVIQRKRKSILKVLKSQLGTIKKKAHALNA